MKQKLTSNNAHNQRMRNGRLDVQRLFIKRFEFFVIFLNGIHLNFQRINLQELCTFFQIIFTVIRLKENMQISEWGH